MAEETITKESVEQKLAKGEALTKDETRFVMSSPPEEGEGNRSGDTTDEEDLFKDAEDIDSEKSPDASAAKPDEEKKDDATPGEKKSDETSASKKEDERSESNT